MKKNLTFIFILLLAGVLIYGLTRNKDKETDQEPVITETDQSFDDYPSDDTDSGELPQ